MGCVSHFCLLEFARWQHTCRFNCTIHMINKLQISNEFRLATFCRLTNMQEGKKKKRPEFETPLHPPSFQQIRSIIRSTGFSKHVSISCSSTSDTVTRVVTLLYNGHNKQSQLTLLNTHCVTGIDLSITCQLQVLIHWFFTTILHPRQYY